MGVFNIPKFKDYRKKVARHKTKKYVNRTNGVKSITDIAIHHSLTMRKLAGSTAEGYARYHVNNLGWPSIGYTYVIEADGTIKYVNDIAKKTYHVGDHNNYAVGIVLSGDFTKEEPTTEQKQSLRNLVSALKEEYPHIKNVKGHSDYSGYEWKACPVFDYKAVLDGKVEKPKEPVNPPNNDKPSKPSNKTISTMADEVIAGKHGNGHANRRKSLGISETEYDKVRKEVNKRAGKSSSSKPKVKSIDQLANEVINGLHGDGADRKKSLGSRFTEVQKRVNDILLSGNKVTSKPKPATLKVGSKVKIKSSAGKYSRANVNIPAKHKNKSYTIQQVSKNDVLIEELYSWVRKSDLQ